jgi:hypothetical protein
MASVQVRAGTYRVIFRFHGKQHFVMVGKVSPQEAAAKAAQVEYLLMRLKQGLIELPAGVDIAEFVQHDGKPPAAEIARSKKRSRTTGHQNGKGRPTTLKGRLATVTVRKPSPKPSPLTVGECHDHFRRTLAGSK